LVGVKYGKWYDYFYLSTIVIGAVVSMQMVTNIIDIAYALMAVPTMLSGFALAPEVMEEARKYFAKLENR
jgi:AGCS family alanine or glycine:cation symporter